MTQTDASPEMQSYFDEIESALLDCYNIATEAKKKRLDPEDFVEMKLAKNMAERVVGLISSVAPAIAETNIAKRILELEKKYSPMDWRVALKIAEEVAKERFCKFSDKHEAIEVGIRTGFAYHTCGIVAAPLEGFIGVQIKKRRDGKEYLSPCYAGPIRGAGGTAAAFSVILTDYVRVKMGYAPYDPDEKEVGRYKSEINDYHERVTNLQYKPSDEEIDFLARHLPVEINGDPTEKFDVSNYKDLPRIESNKIRGGICLVMAEGVAQKSPKLWKRIEKWGKDFSLEWDFLGEFLALQKKIKAKEKGGGSDSGKKKEKLTPNYTYIKDLVAGRPVLSFPMAERGFRLRMGRTRVSGFSSAAMNPITQIFLRKYIATGTQLKVERPGKAASITPCDIIEGPTVLLEDGSVVRVRTVAQAKECQKKVKRILFLGDMMFNYGDFSENGHMLVPLGFNEDWYLREIEQASVEMFGTIDFEKIANITEIKPEYIDLLFKDPFHTKISFRAAKRISTSMNVPLHPYYTYFWKLIKNDDLRTMIRNIAGAKTYYNERKELEKLVMRNKADLKEVLERICIPHMLVHNEYILITRYHSQALLATLGIQKKEDCEEALGRIDDDKQVLENLCSISDIKIYDTCGTFVGARMGRPEKAKMRCMTGSPHVLFPVGEQGGRLRSFQSAIETGYVEADFAIFRCESCGLNTANRVCDKCQKVTKRLYFCRQCQKETEDKECKEHGPTQPYSTQKIDIVRIFSNALRIFGSNSYPDLIKGVRGTSNRDHIPEHIVKGIFRSKHDIYVNKDGTTRFDMTELPITHFKPIEIGASIEKLKKLGYHKDISGQPITDQTQIFELKPHDVVLPACDESPDEQSDKVLVRVARFVDDILVNLYGLQPYYNVKTPEDLIGHLGIGLAPHTSAGMVCRIIGFSKTQGMLCHPMMHAAMRRDCDGDESCVMLALDGLLNFSRKYLPESRGARTMDAPLVLSSKLIPAEVDDQVHGLDVAWQYPLELYRAAMEYKNPWDIKIEQIKNLLGTERQYEKMGFTHDTDNFNLGVNYSAYKVLPSMAEKLEGQMKLAEQIDAVDENEVAKFVINKHFIKDTKGNLRKFSTQQVRCIKCNAKYRRVPLAGKCTKCGGRVIFTVAQGSVIKYFEPMKKLSTGYDVGEYIRQSLDILELRINSVFGKDKEKQEALAKWA